MSVMASWDLIINDLYIKHLSVDEVLFLIIVACSIIQYLYKNDLHFIRIFYMLPWGRNDPYPVSRLTFLFVPAVLWPPSLPPFFWNRRRRRRDPVGKEN